MQDAEHKYPPQELMMMARWIVSDDTKRPIPGTAAKDSALWRSYDAAYAELQDNRAAEHMGVSFFNGVTEAGYKLVCIDIDSCFHEGRQLVAWARAIVDYFDDTYVEVSASGQGIHIFVWVREGDYPGTKHYVEAQVGDEKAPQVQVIGGNDAGYVIVTGDLLEGAPDRIGRVNDLEWLRSSYPPGKGGDVDLTAVQVEQSWTNDADPDFDAIAKKVRAKVGDVLDGEWRSAQKDGKQRFESASEAYFWLVCEVLRACNRDGELAADFLVSEHTGAWGLGCVDGTDPGKYTLRDDWVINRVKKATAVTRDERPDFAAVEELFADEAPGEPEEGEDEEESVESSLGIALPSAFHALYAGVPSLLIDSWLTRQGIVQIYGKPKNGKSLFAMEMAYAIASGASHFHGKAIYRNGPVLILVGEDPHGVANRSKAQEMLNEIGAAAGKTEVPVYFTTRPGNLSDPEGLQRLHDQMEHVKPVAVFNDTQIANMGSIDENDTQQMADLMKRLERISQWGDCCIVNVHHTGKSGRGGARGSSVQAGAISCGIEIIMKREKREDGTTRHLIRAIQREVKNWDALDEIVIPVEARVVGEKPDGEPLTAPALDFEVDPAAVAAGLETVQQESAQEPEVPLPDGGEPPEAALVMLSMEQGWLKRPAVAEHMSEAGYLGAGTANAMRYLEKKLVEKGVLTVQTDRRKGVLYS